ncbi:hypothetical protein E8E11_007620 [Didymella keratinophila]|nr:hypothetical protein E8E11_007620 [Didymella keratinophila]
MLSSTLFFILSALTPTSHSAPALVPRLCYLSGSKWDFGRDEASHALDSLCVTSRLSGVYHGNSKKGACVQLSESRTVDFSIEWLGPKRNQNALYNFTLSDADCRARLRDEIYGCEHGGESQYEHYPDAAEPWQARPGWGEWTFR